MILDELEIYDQVSVMFFLGNQCFLFWQYFRYWLCVKEKNIIFLMLIFIQQIQIIFQLFGSQGIFKLYFNKTRHKHTVLEQDMVNDGNQSKILQYFKKLYIFHNLSCGQLRMVNISTEFFTKLIQQYVIEYLKTSKQHIIDFSLQHIFKKRQFLSKFQTINIVETKTQLQLIIKKYPKNKKHQMSQSSFENQQSSSQFWSSIPQNQKKSDRNIDGNTQHLYESLKYFKEFLAELDYNIVDAEIREDVVEHCGKSLSYHTMDKQFIISSVQQRIEKMIRNNRLKKNWSDQDIKILVWIVSKYADKYQIEDVSYMTEDDWAVIAKLIPGAKTQSCMFKWLNLKKVKLSTNGWDKYESNLLSEIIRESGAKDWKNVSFKLYRKNKLKEKIFRSAKQCRQHWICYLNPNLKKGPWNKHEDLILMKSLKERKCSKRWSEFVHLFQGRTENALKNRYMLLLEKQRKKQGGSNLSEIQLVNKYIENANLSQMMGQDESISSNNNTCHEKQPIKSKPKKITRNSKQKQEKHPKPDREKLNMNQNSIKVIKITDNNFNMDLFQNLIPCIMKGNQLMMNVEYTKNQQITTYANDK